MPYPTRLLNDGEEVALDLRPHWWFFSKHILTGIPLLSLLWVSWKVGNDIVWWFWGLLGLLWAGWLGLQYLNWTFTHFVVTNRRVVFRTGVLAKHGVEIPMDRVANINFNQRCGSASSARAISKSSPRAGRSNEVQRRVASRRGAAGDLPPDGAPRQARGLDAGPAAPAAAAPRPPPALSLAEQLQQLADLRDRGVLTTAEFEAKKAQLLERM